MYTVNKTRSRKKILLTIVTTLLLIFGVGFVLMWFFIIRQNDSNIANFNRTGGNIVAVVEPATKDFTTDEFRIVLPEGWELLGKQNPFYNQEYYEFQSKVKDYDSRWLRVYIDVYPEDYAINRLMPISLEEGKIKTGLLSSDCRTFSGAPKPGTEQYNTQQWNAKWEAITFTCNIGSSVNHVGTASLENGYGVPIKGKSGATHKYFFVYIDHSVRPEYSIFTKALESFVAL